MTCLFEWKKGSDTKEQHKYMKTTSLYTERLLCQTGRFYSCASQLTLATTSVTKAMQVGYVPTLPMM